MVRMAGNSFSRGIGAGSGVAFGLVGSLAILAAAIGAWYWLSKPIAPPKPATVGTAAKARDIALSSLKKRGIAHLAKEVRAEFEPTDNQWYVSGPATTEDDRMVQVKVLLSVGTVNGAQRWKVEVLDIDGKIYIGR